MSLQPYQPIFYTVQPTIRANGMRECRKIKQVKRAIIAVLLNIFLWIHNSSYIIYQPQNRWRDFTLKKETSRTILNNNKCLGKMFRAQLDLQNKRTIAKAHHCSLNTAEHCSAVKVDRCLSFKAD